MFAQQKETPHRVLMLSRSELPNYKYADFLHKVPKDNLALLAPLYY